MKVFAFLKKSHKKGRGHIKVILDMKIWKNCNMTTPPTIGHRRVRAGDLNEIYKGLIACENVKSEWKTFCLFVSITNQS